MAKILNASQLETMRKKKKEKEVKLSALMDENIQPIEAVEDAAKSLPMLRPHSTGDPVRDIVGINHQLNDLPSHFENCSERQLKEAWEGAEKMGRATAWIKGHIIRTLNRKYKEEAVKNFAEEMSLTIKTIYNYMHLAELFPKVDPVLEPTFHFKAIALAHGDKDIAVKLIEKAKEKRLVNPRYSVREFMEESKLDKRPKSEAKEKGIESLIRRVVDGLIGLNQQVNHGEWKGEFEKVNRLVETINIRLRKASEG